MADRFGWRRGGAWAVALLVLWGGGGPAVGAESSGLRGLSVRVHTVRRGETAPALIRKYRTTRGSLEALNPRVDLDRLQQGDRVAILSRPGVFQRLHRGLTVSDVARVYGADVDDLLAFNGISNPRRVPENLELFIPDADPLTADKLQRLKRQQRARAEAEGGRPVPRGYFGKPVDVSGRLVVSDGYGRRLNPISREPQLHAGTDLVAPFGTPVLAARDGVVERAEWYGGYGRLVVLDHGDGISTYYGHCHELLVRPGQAVVRGQPIASVGSSGDATGPHLHFEVRVRGTPKNPARWLRGHL